MTVYYVDNVLGDNANLGTSAGSGNAWNDVAYALTQVAQGDHVYVKGGTTYTETNLLVTAGDRTDYIRIEGYTTTPGDRGRAVLDPTAAVDVVAQTSGAVGYHCYRWENITFNGGVRGYDDPIAINCVFYNCIFSNNSDIAINGGDGWIIANCDLYGNGGAGDYCIDIQNESTVYRNNWYNNVNGCLIESGSFVGNLSTQFSASGSGLVVLKTGIASSVLIAQNTFDGENATPTNGLTLSSNVHAYCIYDNIIYDLNKGISGAGTQHEDAYLISNNLFNSNATNDLDSLAALYQYDEQTTAPAFTNEAGDDYTLGSSSDAIDNASAPGTVT